MIYEIFTKALIMFITKKIFSFYYEGFRNMKIGKKLWLIILLKLFVMFAILKLFFFKDFLKTNFDSNKARSEYVLKKLTEIK
jgi:hypothetical protein